MKSSLVEKYDKLRSLADKTGGVFTTVMAESCGFVKDNHRLKVASGVWEKVGRGIYRFSGSGDEAMGELGECLLWTQRRGSTDLLGVISHSMAFHLWDLCDYVSHSIDITVPPSFKRMSAPPSSRVVLHGSDLPDSDVTSTKGISRITTPMRTLIDCYAEQVIHPQDLEEFYMMARREYLISATDVETAGSFHGRDFFERLERLFLERKVK
jgi:predicted transcriptional regulator of viral defense system